MISIQNIKDKKNGLLCPKCGEEMIDVDRERVSLSDPPQFEIECEHCGYTGSRYLEGVWIGEMNHKDGELIIKYNVEEIINSLEKAITIIKNYK